MTKLQELIKVHNQNRNSYSSATAYRGVKYEVGSVPIEKSQGTFVYRGRTYTKWSPWKHFKLEASYALDL